MDFYEVLETRRSIRKFAQEPIPQAVLERVMLAAGMAPSGSNRQNWKYIIVSDIELQKKVQLICLDQKHSLFSVSLLSLVQSRLQFRFRLDLA